MARCYGNLVNRIDENKNFNKDNIIHVGDDITMYYWSDRACYFVTDVVNQKHIKVKKYEVVADQSKPGGPGHQNWLYFKTRKEKNEYLKHFFDREFEDFEHDEETWIYRYGKWKKAEMYIKEDLDSENMFGQKLRDVYFTDKEIEKLENNEVVYRYHDLPGKISFGVKSYYYDWEF